AALGLATFSTLTLDQWGNYTLEATTPIVPAALGGPVDPATSGTITVTANKLVFIATPPAVKSGVIFPSSVVVDAEDITGARAKNFTGDVTVAINTAVQVQNGSLDISATAQLGGTKTVTAVLGRATFNTPANTLTLDQWGDYTLKATTPPTSAALGG